MLLKALLACCALAAGLSFAADARAAPKFKLIASTASAEKGHVFEIYVAVETDETLESLTFAPLAPENFYVKPNSIPGLAGVSRNPDDSVTVASLAKGSSITVPFKVVPPAQFRFPFLRAGGKEEKEQSLDTTRDLKAFIFNISYVRQTESGPVLAHQTESISIRYTTSLLVYLLTGIAGVLLGFVVKTITQDKDLLAAPAKGHKGFFGAARSLLRHVFLTRLPLLLTALVIGFGVLLALAQEKIPANGWFHAVALGIGISILSDEKLITKLPKPGGSA